MKQKQDIAWSAVILFTGTIMSKILGFVRELVVAYRFGAGAVSDAFVLTNSIPNMLFVSIATAITINYIPVVSEIKEDQEKNNFTTNLINICCVILVVGCLIVQLIPEKILWIFASGFSDETEKMAVMMLRIVIFSIFPIILGYVFQAYSQVTGQFYSTALFGVIVNIVTIGFTFISTEKTYYLLSIGTVSANLVGTVILFYFAKKGGYKYQFNRKLQYDDRVKKLILLTLPLLIENIASDLSLLVDKNLASYLSVGTLSGLSYAGILGNIASTMIATSIITATFPMFSKLISNKDKEFFNEQFSKYGIYMCYILAPIMAYMFFMSKEIVIFIFERGAFNSTATSVVHESMLAYAIGILPMGLQSYIIRGFYALKDTKTPVIIKVFSLLCNIVMNFVLVKKWRHIGIALSTSISYFIALFLLIIFIYKRHKIVASMVMLREFFYCMVIAVFCGIFAKKIIVWFNIEGIFLSLMLSGLILIAVYFLCMFFTKKSVRELLKFKSKI